MQKSVALFVATTLIASAAAIYFRAQLQSERHLAIQQKQQAQSAVSMLQVQKQPTLESELPASYSIAPIDPQPAANMVTPQKACALSPTDVWDQLLPRLRGELRGMARQVTAANYPGVAEELGLNEAETIALLDLLQRHQALQNFMPDSYTSSEEVIRQEIERARAELPRLQNTELAALLGPAKYSKWQAFQPTLEAHRQLDVLIRNNRSGMPGLSEAQTRSLVTIIAAEKWRALPEATTPRSAAANTTAQLDLEEKVLNTREESGLRMLEAARPYLDAQQYASLKDTMTRLVSSDRMRLQGRRKQLESGAGK